jgi:hypothetical protein
MQTTVLAEMKIGIPGQLATEHDERTADIVTRTSEEASASIPFGVFVQKGTDDGDVKKLTATTNKLIGIVVWEANFAPVYQVDSVGLKPGVTMSILRKGKIIVVPETDVVAHTSEVHVRAIVAGSEVAGAVRATADSTDTIDITAFATWLTSATAGNPAVLEIDMANAALAVAD